MRARTFAKVKEDISAGKPAANEAVGSAQVRNLHEYDPFTKTVKSAGPDAARRAALISLGKKSILFRFGNAQNERSGAIEELGAILRGSASKYPVHLTAVICGTALHELTFDQCGTCFGRGEVQVQDLEGRQPMSICGTCNGLKRTRFKEDERIPLLARYIAATAKIDHENDIEYHEFVTFTAKELRSSRRLREILHAVDFATGLILDAERASVEGAAQALGKGDQE
jgi:hypothetical protein